MAQSKQGEALRKDDSRLGHQMARNIIEILKANGIEVPDDKTADLEKDVVKDYKSVAIVTDLQGKLTQAEKDRDEYKGTAEKFKDSKPEDYEQIKADYAKLKADAEKRIKDDAAAEQRKAFEADFDRALGERKFVNGFVRKSVMADVLAAREKDQASGISDLIDSVTKDQEGVFVNPNAKPDQGVKVPEPGTAGKDKNDECLDDDAIRRITGLPADYKL